MKLTPSDALSLLRKAIGSDVPKALTIVLPPKRPALLKFARFLADYTTIHAITPEAAQIKASSGLHPIPLPEKTNANQFAAWNAIRNRHQHVVLCDTMYDNAMTSLTTRTGAERKVSSLANGCEMLPDGSLTFYRPLLDVAPDVLDEQVESIGADLSEIIAHGERKRDACTSLSKASEILLHNAICDASHWGYVVLRRSVLANEYNSNSKLVAQDALRRIMSYCSGSPTPISITAEHVVRVSDEVLGRVNAGKSLPIIPKGRTAGGMVVRRATGRFAKKVAYNDARRRRLPRFRDDESDDLMIITREPDHETSGLEARRLGGNMSCIPLPRNGSVYWDNRYVMVSKSSDTERVIVDDAEILEAALRPAETLDMNDSELYVRQIRKLDWERITAATDRVREFQIPFECIRALPGIFEKNIGDMEQGNLTASPHLGLTARADLLFTAVRVPRFRTLPRSICPGFVGKAERQQRAEQRAESEKRRRRARAQGSYWS